MLGMWMFLRLKRLLHLHKIDGSRITVIGFKEEEDKETMVNYVCIGDYNPNTNMIELNPDLFYEDDVELICAVISHEFLHMLLDLYINPKASKNLDYVCPNYDRAYVKHGGI